MGAVLLWEVADTKDQITPLLELVLSLHKVGNGGPVRQHSY